MKKGTLFKILTLFLTFVIFSCCSGCFLWSCISSHMDKQEAEKKAKLMEVAKAEKLKADAFIPQVDDYILELKPLTYFESDEQAYEEGFFRLRFQDPEYHKEAKTGTYELSFYRDDNESNIITWFINERKNPSQNYKYKFQSNLNNIYGYDFFFSSTARYCGWFKPYLLEYDGKLFAFQVVHYINIITLRDVCEIIPPALYQIDIENGQFLYCGYFKEWYDDIFNNYRAGATTEYYYKITKKINEGEKNEEN